MYLGKTDRFIVSIGESGSRPLELGARIMLAIIQARMSSHRLPGKVLTPVAGKPILKRVYERLSKSKELSEIVVATSQAASDQLIVDFCVREGIPVHQGSLDNVSERLLDCARNLGANRFVRISGDSPLIDPSIVDQAVLFQRGKACDLATNVQVRSYPKGQSVEVIRTDSFAEACERMRIAEDFEHVTRFFYHHPEDFSIENFSCDEPMADIQLSVDTAGDLKAVETVLAQLDEDFSWREAATLMSELRT